MAPRLAPITTVAAGALLAAYPLGAQAVMVAPHLITLEHSTRGGSVTLYNPGTEEIEVEVGLAYGLPMTDSLGDFTLSLTDPGEREATSWLAAYPRRMRLKPQQRQAIRLLASPKAGIEDGEYWARLVVTTRKAAPPETSNSDATIAIGLNVELRTVLPVLYRKGSPSVTAEIGEPVVSDAIGDSVAVTIPLTPVGNAAFLGSLHAAFVDASGNTLAQAEMPLSLYTASAPRLSLPKPGGTPTGLIVTVRTQRGDLESDQILSSRPVTRTVPIGR